ncbi:MAG: transcription elongation factor GreA [Deltaproteobacteria bacterium]|nr:transcription elongation factor GreA [Deltaproteobacteria bacterium]
MERVPMTPGCHARMKQELDRRKADRASISNAIEVARDHGDLKENAEYHAAKDQQGLNEAHINDLEDKLSRAEVIDPTTLSGDRVKFGATVELEDVESGKTLIYVLLGPEESDIEKGHISVTSPVARALIAHEVGDEIRVKVPGGLRTLEIVDVRWE